MAEYLIQDTTLKNIADSIRTHGNYTAAMNTNEMTDKISGMILKCITGDLTEVVVPVNNLRFGSFAEFWQLIHVILSESLGNIPDYAFYHCNNLAEITIPSNVTMIGDRAFYGCSSLTSVTIPDSVKWLLGYAFAYCNGLENVRIECDFAERLSDYAFMHCNNLKTVTFTSHNPSGTGIPANFFANCNNLTTINVPWSEGSYSVNAPWGAENATINYNYTEG